MKINERNLCVFASSAPFDMEGFLSKRGEVNKSFQRRYFVLKGNLLFYFERKADKEPLGLIIVEGCTIELSEESDQYCFEIAFNGNRTYILSADSQESMETWMKALTCAGYEYKKLMVAELQRQLEEIEGLRNKMLGLDSSAASESVTVAAPKPPPRRQNPFNRPAPPLPAPPSNGQNGGPVVPFINGHFGSTSQRSSCANNAHATPLVSGTTAAAAAADSSPKPPPRSVAKSEFYSQLPRQQQLLEQPTSAKQPAVFADAVSSPTTQPPPLASLTSTDDLGNHHHSSVHFEQLHERFRQLVMKDVRSYHEQRELKSQPLIQL